MKFQLILLTLLFPLFVQPSFAEKYGITFDNDENKFPKVIDLNWLNQKFLDKQRARANDILAENFGGQFHGAESDVTLIQRILDEELIKPNEKESLQSLGVILGDLYAAKYQSLNWKVFEDEYGKSHAVCVNETKECIFPITMLSRRVELGLKPNAQKVYEIGLDLIYEKLPKMPFTRKPY